MAKYTDILENFSEKFPLLARLYELYSHLPSLAPNEENTLRKTSELTLMEIIELVVIASRQYKNQKKDTLVNATYKLDQLRVLTELAKETKAIDANKFNEIQEVIDAVGKMIGGWLKSTAANAKAAAEPATA